jgi:hypothetical protein
MLFALIALSACGDHVREQGKLMCQNRMLFAQTRAESVKVLDEIVYTSAIDGDTKCGNIDSLAKRKP